MWIFFDKYNFSQTGKSLLNSIKPVDATISNKVTSAYLINGDEKILGYFDRTIALII
jgi:hypothetical protein